MTTPDFLPSWPLPGNSFALFGLLLLAGALGDRFGRHRALAAGLLVFGLGSVLAALASTPDQLIATRALMGVGAALVMPATLSIISTSDRPAASATAMTGRLTRKTELHAKCSSSQPPASPPPPAR